MTEVKTCKCCNQTKEVKDFYASSGNWRSECKQCTIKRNVRYQKRTQSWKTRYLDDDSRKTYMRDYYAKNKEKFAKYRAEFVKRHPDYYKDYFRKQKE